MACRLGSLGAVPEASWDSERHRPESPSRGPGAAMGEGTGVHCLLGPLPGMPRVGPPRLCLCFHTDRPQPWESAREPPTGANSGVHGSSDWGQGGPRLWPLCWVWPPDRHTGRAPETAAACGKKGDPQVPPCGSQACEIPGDRTHCCHVVCSELAADPADSLTVSWSQPRGKWLREGTGVSWRHTPSEGPERGPKAAPFPLGSRLRPPSPSSRGRVRSVGAEAHLGGADGLTKLAGDAALLPGRVTA